MFDKGELKEILLKSLAQLLIIIILFSMETSLALKVYVNVCLSGFLGYEWLAYFHFVDGYISI